MTGKGEGKQGDGVTHLSMKNLKVSKATLRGHLQKRYKKLLTDKIMTKID